MRTFPCKSLGGYLIVGLSLVDEKRLGLFFICFFYFYLQESADNLAHEVSLAVYRLAGGVGDEPKPLH